MSARVTVAALALVLAGCQAPPQVTFYTPPPSIEELGIGPAPPGPTGPVSVPSGTYAGTGRVTINPTGVCNVTIRIYNFKVSGSEVHFGSFNGTIMNDGRLQMQYGGVWITGRFIGDQFDGRVDPPGPWECGYTMSLTRTAS